MKRLGIVLAALLVIVLAAPVADAEHEVFYRYTVLGYIKDARGKPVAGRDVMVIRDKTGFSYLGDTDARGFYVVIVRLGDESLGERLTVRSAGATTRIVAQFEPANRTDERGTRVDMEGRKMVERAAWFPSTLALFLGKR